MADEILIPRNNVVQYDYGTSDGKKSDSGKAPKFNGNCCCLYTSHRVHEDE